MLEHEEYVKYYDELRENLGIPKEYICPEPNHNYCLCSPPTWEEDYYGSDDTDYSDDVIYTEDYFNTPQRKRFIKKTNFEEVLELVRIDLELKCLENTGQELKISQWKPHKE